MKSTLFGVTINSYCNYLFLISHLIRLIFMKKLGRKLPFPSMSFLVDVFMFVISYIFMNFVGKLTDELPETV